MKTKGIFGMALALILSAAMAIPASAAEVTDGSYGYLAGQQKNSKRHAQYEQTATLSTDADRNAFFAANGIGGGVYSDAQHFDADALAAAGIIDQATADSIHQYAANKHTQLSGRYGSMENMTPAERHVYYAGFDRSGGDSVDALLASGIITQEQAEAINAYLAE